ncbi:M56 family metallopeptidase [Labilibacter marinus]|uniref:M56 family metallopeptidase n=1 Tax=Labilibacter marinus TaxID=1477105 RepID=UPI00083681D8|nr:M56 family metallopeptidase [Labilibacter marinus]
MAKFLLYLFESGLCLTLFYLGYVIFFRKETYFTFNRIYLLTSMALALLMPLIPLQLEANETEYINEALTTVGTFRNYYEDFVYHFDAEYDAPVINDTNQNAMLSQSFVSSSVNIIKLIFYIYIVGLLFFSLRLIFLLYHLSTYIRKNHISVSDGFSVVSIKEEAPSFSFLKWIFVNEENLKPEEFRQVLAHEKVHVQHKHSVDLILAHIITMFQWFNPLTWRIQKSLKTCHEYIADRQVINQGHELFDYQSLLLSQLISIRSVELVNNFNLLSIKKRIAMMNKIKSGRIAKLKAVLVIPIIAFAFIFFANCTESFNDSADNTKENSATLKSVSINLPTANEVKEYDKNFILCTLTLSKDGFYYNDAKHDFDKVDELIASIDLSEYEGNGKKMTVLLNIDKSVKMGQMDQVRQALRNHNLLKVGYLVKDGKALFMLLPPKNAMLLDEDKIANLFKINLKGDKSTTDVAADLTNYIYEYNDCVLSYKYDNSTTYEEFVGVADMVFHSINNIRRAEAKANGENFDTLEGQAQKVYRKKYPIRLVQINTDVE